MVAASIARRAGVSSTPLMPISKSPRRTDWSMSLKATCTNSARRPSPLAISPATSTSKPRRTDGSRGSASTNGAPPSASPPQRSTRSSAPACTATSAHTIAAVFMKPSEEFIRREPYFTIVTDPRYLAANRTADAEREFFQSGENDVAEIYDIARLRVAASFAPRRVLEYGCSIGRLAVALARRAEHVTAVDSSPAMLAAARRAENIAYVQELDAGAKFDLITCFLVLQRLPRRRGLSLLRELLGRLDDGGVLVAQVPFHRPPKPLAWIRERVPGANALANIARRKPLDTPLIPTTTYDIGEIVSIIRDEGCSDPYPVFARHGDADAVVLYTRRPPRHVAAAPQRDASFVDVNDLIARSSIDELNQTAEAYFASLPEWDFHLAKPFSSADEAPAMLINLAVL